MKKSDARLQLVCFTLFIGVFFVLLLALPRRAYSEDENRYLAQAPKFSLQALFSGRFTEDFEDFITDQFPFRDRWLGLKAQAERVSGKTENNGVFFCGDTLISRFEAPEQEQVDSAVAALRALDENTDVPVYLALIPSAAAVWAEKLPKHADTADQAALLREIYDASGLVCADVLGALRERAAEPVYYRTDHHWTSLGAYYGYRAAAAAMGLTPTALERYSPSTVSDAFYGTVYSSSGVRWLAADSITAYVPSQGVTVTRYEGAEGTPGLVYDPAKLETKDKYAYFFGGNTPRMVVETGNPGGRLLVLRDSYADSELPFFFPHFSQLHVLDLRYYRQSIQAYIQDNGIDQVLVNYSLANFVSDASVFLLGT